MKKSVLQPGYIVEFRYDDERVKGTVISAGQRRVHIQSGHTGVYVHPNDVIRVVRIPDKNEIPLLGERLRFSGGIDQ